MIPQKLILWHPENFPTRFLVILHKQGINLLHIAILRSHKRRMSHFLSDKCNVIISEFSCYPYKTDGSVSLPKDTLYES